MQQVLVTGFIAGQCILQLLDQGYRVRTTVRSPGRVQSARVALEGAGMTAGDRLAPDQHRDPLGELAETPCDRGLDKLDQRLPKRGDSQLMRDSRCGMGGWPPTAGPTRPVR
jgi:nucleoside-diphosphate-sugar epimerase